MAKPSLVNVMKLRWHDSYPKGSGKGVKIDSGSGLRTSVLVYISLDFILPCAARLDHSRLAEWTTDQSTLLGWNRFIDELCKFFDSGDLANDFVEDHLSREWWNLGRTGASKLSTRILWRGLKEREEWLVFGRHLDEITKGNSKVLLCCFWGR